MRLPKQLDRATVDEILAACSDSLPFNIIEDLGCGNFGCAFLTDQHTVLKLTKHKKEVDVAYFLKDNQLHQGLPKVFEVLVWDDCHGYDDSVYVIHRENLKNLNIPNQWFESVVGGLESRLLDGGEQRLVNNLITEDEIYDTLLELFEEFPGQPEHEILVEKIAELYAFLVKQGMWIDDAIVQNFGMRNGQPVLRDLGALFFVKDLDISAMDEDIQDKLEQSHKRWLNIRHGRDL